MTDPGNLRQPNLYETRVMSRRAIWLIVLNFLVPGLPQVAAGNRRLGRIGLIATLINVIAVVGLLVIALTNKPLLATLVTNAIGLWAVQIYLVVFGLLVIVLTLDTLRLVRIVRLSPRSRLIAPLSVVAVLALVVSGLSYAVVQTSVARDLLGSVFGDGVVVQPVDGRYNFLLLGGDSGTGRIGLRPDSISVVSVDATTGAMTIVGIPRNLQRVPFPASSPMHSLYPDGFNCGNECLINALYTEGENHADLYPNAKAEGSSPGIEATKDGVEGATGLAIQYYVLVNMAGFKKLIDALGGITVTVEKRVELVSGSDENPTSHGWIEAGTQHMDGKTALWFARSRKTTSDYDRMARQRLIEKAIITQFSPLTVVTKFQAVAEASKATLETDIPEALVPTLVDLAEKSQGSDPVSIDLTPANGVVTADPDFKKIRTMVKAALAESSSAASSSASSGSDG